MPDIPSAATATPCLRVPLLPPPHLPALLLPPPHLPALLLPPPHLPAPLLPPPHLPVPLLPPLTCLCRYCLPLTCLCRFSHPLPVLLLLQEMRSQRIFMSDIPLHDMSRDFTLLGEQRHVEACLKEKFEKLTMDLMVGGGGRGAHHATACQDAEAFLCIMLQPSRMMKPSCVGL